MFANYLVTAFRNLTRHPLFAFISIAGLTAGLACVMFIILFIRDEISYDKWIPGTKDLYRAEATLSIPGKEPLRESHSPFPMVKAMADQIPEVKAMTRLVPQSMTIMVANRPFAETVAVVDPNFFTIVQLPFLSGTPKDVFAQPESAVISEEMALKYFGTTDAKGKTIIASRESCDEDRRNCQSQQLPLVVTGVMRDLPHNTQLSIDIAIPNTSTADPMVQSQKENWLRLQGWGYVVLAPGSDPNVVAAKLKGVIDRSFDPMKLVNINVPASQLLSPTLSSFVDDHLSTDRYGSMRPAGSWTTIYGFAIIGALILVVACFNFTNLMTARATLRAREISLRKVVGASRPQLAVQFLGEAQLVAGIALVLSSILLMCLLPAFSSLLQVPIKFGRLSDWPLFLLFAGVAVSAGLLGGAYPAFILSGVRPGIALRGNSKNNSGSARFRTLLVIIQFSVSIGLGIVALVVFSQISFARKIDLGFRKDNIVLITARDLSPTGRESLAQKLRQNPQIVDVTLSDTAPFSNRNNNLDVRAPGQSLSELYRVVSAGPEFPSLYNIKVIAGRPLSASRPLDTFSQDGSPYNILINAAAAKHFGYQPETAVGKNITVHGTAATIVGVLADVRMAGALEPATGTIYRYLPLFSPIISVKVHGEDVSGAVASIDKTWRSFAPGIAIRRHFLDSDFQKQFETSERQGWIFCLFVMIAISISCLGLFGLAAFTAQQKIREIGIRKVFGATTGDIIISQLWIFSKPVLLANVISWPLAYWYLRNWLSGYASHISLSPGYFVLAGGVALVIALSTIYVIASRAANAKPISALRYE